MYADRNKKGLSPAGMGAALVINAGLFAVLMGLTPNVVQIVERPFDGFNVPADPPPPPPPPPPQPETKKIVETTPKTEVFVKPPIIDTHPPDPGFVTTTTEPPPPGPGPIGTEGTGGGVTVDPPKPPPVFTGVEVDPRYAGDFQPEYPPDMRRAESEGTVVVRVLVGTNGRVKAVELVKSPSDSFFNVTKRQALSRWRFKPATEDGVPVEKWKVMTLHFRLTDA
jgi:periplasmic protein TonB